MSLSIQSGSSVSSVTLAMFRSESAALRRSEGSDGHRHHHHHGHGATPLATAMAEALRTLGWTPQAPAAAAPATAPAPGTAPASGTAPTSGTTPVATPIVTAPAAAEADAPETADAPADLPAAMAGFAEALMAALREAGGSQGRGRDRDGDGLRDNGDNGRRAWGYGRAVGVIAMRLEQVISGLKAAQPTPVPAPTVDAAPAPVADPAPTVDATAPTPDAVTPPAPDAAAAPADPTSAAPAPAEPLPGEAPVVDVAPAPAPAPTTSPLADAFAQLLDALRDNGAAVPADGDPAAQMIDFLQALAGGLRPEGGGSTTVTGLFIRISV